MGTSANHSHEDREAISKPGELGDWIRRERQRQHFSQRELATRAGMSRSYLCDIERGRGASPSVSTLDRIATALSVARTDLLQIAGIVDPPAGQNSVERRLMALFRDLSENSQSSVERYIRFLYEEEHRFVQTPLIDSGEEDLSAPGGPTLFDMTPLR